MDKVDFDAIHFRLELMELVEFGLVFTPILVIQPVVGEVFHVGQVCPHAPTRAVGLIRPTSPFQTRLEIIQC